MSGQLETLLAATATDRLPSFDTVLAQHATRRPEAIAIVDPANRSLIDATPPKSLNFAELDALVTTLARQFLVLGLPKGSVIAVRLPNMIEAVAVMLAAWRAGLVVVPLTLAMESGQLRDALMLTGARAVVTCARCGHLRPAREALEAARGLFSLRFVAIVGAEDEPGTKRLFITPDGHREPFARHAWPGQTVLVTLEKRNSGLIAVPRSSAQLLAAGLAVIEAVSMQTHAPIHAILGLSRLAGLGGALVPWLIGGGTLALHHPWNADAVAGALAAHPAGLVLMPARLLDLFDNAPLAAEAARCHALVAMGDEPMPASTPRNIGAPIVDIWACGELALIARAPRPPVSGPTHVETRRSRDGDLQARGAMVPSGPFPPGPARPETARLVIDSEGWVSSGIKLSGIEATPDEFQTTHVAHV